MNIKRLFKSKYKPKLHKCEDENVVSLSLDGFHIFGYCIKCEQYLCKYDYVDYYICDNNVNPTFFLKEAQTRYEKLLVSRFFTRINNAKVNLNSLNAMLSHLNIEPIK